MVADLLEGKMMLERSSSSWQRWIGVTTAAKLRNDMTAVKQGKKSLTRNASAYKASKGEYTNLYNKKKRMVEKITIRRTKRESYWRMA